MVNSPPLSLVLRWPHRLRVAWRTATSSSRPSSSTCSSHRAWKSLSVPAGPGFVAPQHRFGNAR